MPSKSFRVRTPSQSNVVSLARCRPGRNDACLNAEWDRLIQLAEDAWTWRDPQTLAAVVVCVVRLGQHVLKEWSDQ